MKLTIRNVTNAYINKDIVSIEDIVNENSSILGTRLRTTSYFLYSISPLVLTANFYLKRELKKKSLDLI